MMQLGFTYSDPADCTIPDIEPQPVTATTRSRFQGTQLCLCYLEYNAE